MPLRRLVPLVVPPGPAVVDVLPALAEALAGRGPARRPCAPEDDPGVRTLDPADDDPDDPTALVVATSGSTGSAKAALLPAGALRASAAATADRLGGPARPGTWSARPETWVLALPGRHIAGLQVLLRSLRAGTEPVVVDLVDGFTPAAFVAAVESAGSGPLRTSLVPTQLARLVAAAEDPAGTDQTDPGTEEDRQRVRAALRRLDPVLVGAAATPPALLARARALGVAVVTTYGSSETCGGCVYDGAALDGVAVELEERTGRVLLSGPVVARGYLDDPAATRAAFDRDRDGRRRFRTDDAGLRTPDGGLQVTGRLDDLITTGGLKIAPVLVEAALATDPTVAEVVVVGTPDPEWGQVVTACVVPTPGTRPDLARLRATVTATLPSSAAPRRLLLLAELPLRGPGKPDRRRLVELCAAAVPDAGPGNTAGPSDV